MKTAVLSVALACSGSALALPGGLPAGGEVVSPDADMYVNKSGPGYNYGTSELLLVGGGRESLIRFDVSGMQNVTNAVLWLYVTQHADDADSLIAVRSAYDVLWGELTATFNSMAHEVPDIPSPWIAQTDFAYVGLISGIENQAWTSVDVTASVTNAAAIGKVSYHLQNIQNKSATADGFASRDCSDASVRPVLVVLRDTTVPVMTSAAVKTATLSPSDDVFFYNNSVQNAAALLTDPGVRESLIKFDLSAVAGRTVGGATLRLVGRGASGKTVAAGVGIVRVTGTKSDWTESTITWANKGDYGVSLWSKDWPPVNGVRLGTFVEYATNVVDVTELVKSAAASGSLSLQMYATGGFASFNSKDCGDPALVPQLTVVSVDDSAYHPVTEVESRPPLHYARPSRSAPDTANYENADIQTGCQSWRTTPICTVPFFQFDPAGLAEVPYVHLRLKTVEGHSDNLQTGPESVYFKIGPKWTPANVTWNKQIPGMEITYPTSTAWLGNQISLLQYGSVTQDDLVPYLEFDVTECVREAARCGELVTFQVQGGDNAPWRWFYTQLTGTPAYRPQLVYPKLPVFADVQFSADLSQKLPPVTISWTPGSDGTAYSVVREDESGAMVAIAEGVTDAACVDAETSSKVAYAYHLTAVSPDGTVSTRTVTNQVDRVRTLQACADTHVYQQDVDTAFGTNLRVVHKFANGTDREGFYRFDLTGLDLDFVSKVELVLMPQTMSSFSGDEEGYVREVADAEWTDDNALTWNSAGLKAPTPRTAEGIFATIPYKDFGLDVPIAVDVTAKIRAAIAESRSHVTFHVFGYDPGGAATVAVYARENPLAVNAAHLKITHKNWSNGGFSILIR